MLLTIACNCLDFSIEKYKKILANSLEPTAIQPLKPIKNPFAQLDGSCVQSFCIIFTIYFSYFFLYIIHVIFIIIIFFIFYFICFISIIFFLHDFIFALFYFTLFDVM